MDEVAVEFRMTREQREALKTEAEKRGLKMQELLELTVFHELRPRKKRGPKPRSQREVLPIAV